MAWVGALDFHSAPNCLAQWPIGGFTAEDVVVVNRSFAVIVLANDQDAPSDTVVLKIMAPYAIRPICREAVEEVLP